MGIRSAHRMGLCPQLEIVQSILFVKFNLLAFGDPCHIPKELRDPVQYHYLHGTPDPAKESDDPGSSDIRAYWHLVPGQEGN